MATLNMYACDWAWCLGHVFLVVELCSNKVGCTSAQQGSIRQLVFAWAGASSGEGLHVCRSPVLISAASLSIAVPPLGLPHAASLWMLVLAGMLSNGSVLLSGVAKVGQVACRDLCVCVAVFMTAAEGYTIRQCGRCGSSLLAGELRHTCHWPGPWLWCCMLP